MEPLNTMRFARIPETTKNDMTFLRPEYLNWILTFPICHPAGVPPNTPNRVRLVFPSLQILHLFNLGVYEFVRLLDFTKGRKQMAKVAMNSSKFAACDQEIFAGTRVDAEMAWV